MSRGSSARAAISSVSGSTVTPSFPLSLAPPPAPAPLSSPFGFSTGNSASVARSCSSRPSRKTVNATGVPGWVRATMLRNEL